MEPLQEELIVLFHAALIGRTDVVQNAIASIKSSGNFTDEEVSSFISTGRSEDNATPLHIAANFGHTDVIRALLNSGADVTAAPSVGEYQGMRPYELGNDATKQVFHIHLFEQIAMGNVTAVARMVGVGKEGAGIPVDVADDSQAQDSTLHWAASFGSTEVGEVLMARGCFVDVRNQEGQTPLHLACRAKHRPMIMLLLDEGADPDAKDKQGRSPKDMLRGTSSTSSSSGGRNGATASADGNESKSNSSVPVPAVAEPLLKLLEEPTAAPSKRLHKEFIEQQRKFAEQQRREHEELLRLQNQQQQLRHVKDGSSTGGATQQQIAATKPADPAAGISAEGDGDADSNGTVHHGGSDDDDEAEDWNILESEDQGSGRHTGRHTGRHGADSMSSRGGEVLLIFWPPVKHQSRNDALGPLLLSSAENLLICVSSSDIDIFPLLTWSGLMDAMDGFGLQAQVKRSSSGAKIRLAMDRNLCPTSHSYSLSVDAEQILLVAADHTGLLYGTYTLIQLLQLHSEVRRSGSSSSSSSGGGIVTTLLVPPVSIRDHPDVADRAVLWSYRHHARTASTRMREQIELLSRLRINKLFLAVDPAMHSPPPLLCQPVYAAAAASADSPLKPHASSAHAGTPARSTAAAAAAASNGSSSNPSDATGTKIYALDEVCRRHCVEMVPTLIITSIYHKLPQDVLKNFSNSLISLVFAFDFPAVAAEIARSSSSGSSSSGSSRNSGTSSEDRTATVGREGGGRGAASILAAVEEEGLILAEDVDEVSAAAACRAACEGVIRDVHLAGFTSMVLACSDWTRAVAQPVLLASEVGLNAQERDFSSMFPASLFSKPIISVQQYTHSIFKYTSNMTSSNSNCATFPAFMDRDFLYPALCIKFYCFMFAGFVWNSASIVDMLGSPADSSFSPALVREVMSLVMFNGSGGSGASSSGDSRSSFLSGRPADVSKAAFQAMMVLLTGEIGGEAAAAAAAGLDGDPTQPLSDLPQHGSLAAPTASGGLRGLGSRSDNKGSAKTNSQSHGSSGASQGGGVAPAPSAASATSCAALARAEKLLWALLTTRDEEQAAAAPSRAEAGECLKLYRRVLNMARWKPDSMQTTRSSGSLGMLSFVGLGMGLGGGGGGSGAQTAFSRNLDDPLYEASGSGIESISALALEVEELFCVINLLSVLSKGLVFAYKARLKQQPLQLQQNTLSDGAADQVLSYQELLAGLNVGTKSDVANSILGSLSSCTFLWKRRFDRQLMLGFKSNNSLLGETAEQQQHGAQRTTTGNSPSGGAKQEQCQGWQALLRRTLRDADRRFLLQVEPQVPGAATFRVLSRQLPLPRSVEEFIQRLFAR